MNVDGFGARSLTLDMRLHLLRRINFRLADIAHDLLFIGSTRVISLLVYWNDF